MSVFILSPSATMDKGTRENVLTILKDLDEIMDKGDVGTFMKNNPNEPCYRQTDYGRYKIFGSEIVAKGKSYEFFDSLCAQVAQVQNERTGESSVTKDTVQRDLFAYARDTARMDPRVRAGDFAFQNYCLVYTEKGAPQQCPMMDVTGSNYKFLLAVSEEVEPRDGPLAIPLAVTTDGGAWSRGKVASIPGSTVQADPATTADRHRVHLFFSGNPQRIMYTGFMNLS